MATLFAAFCVVQARWRENASAPQFAGMARLASVFRRSIWALLAPPVVMGGIYLGIFTASEAAAAGCVYALLIAVLVYRNFGLRDLYEAAYATMRTSLMVFLIIAGAAMFGHAITIIRLPVSVTEWVTQMGLGPLAIHHRSDDPAIRARHVP